MSQVTAMNVTLPVIVVCAGSSAVTVTVAVAFTSAGLPRVLGQLDELPLPPLLQMDTM